MAQWCWLFHEGVRAEKAPAGHMPPAQSLPVQIERHLWLPGGCGPERCLCSRVRALLLLGTCRDMGHCLQGCKCHAPAEGVAVKSRADNGSYLVVHPSNAQHRDPNLYAMYMRGDEAQRRGPRTFQNEIETQTYLKMGLRPSQDHKAAAFCRRKGEPKGLCQLCIPWESCRRHQVDAARAQHVCCGCRPCSEQNTATARAVP